jgi:hypothetical protein
VQPFYRRTGGEGAGHGTIEGGAAGTRPLEIDGRVACACRAWVDSGQGRAIWPWADRGLPGTVLWRGSPACIISKVAGGRCPSMGQNRGGERREREGERKGSRFKLNFL